MEHIRCDRCGQRPGKNTRCHKCCWAQTGTTAELAEPGDERSSIAAADEEGPEQPTLFD